jgi:hypothetical protein
MHLFGMFLYVESVWLIATKTIELAGLILVGTKPRVCCFSVILPYGWQPFGPLSWMLSTMLMVKMMTWQSMIECV